jgi:hypothetical protein
MHNSCVLLCRFGGPIYLRPLLWYERVQRRTHHLHFEKRSRPQWSPLRTLTCISLKAFSNRWLQPSPKSSVSLSICGSPNTRPLSVIKTSSLSYDVSEKLRYLASTNTSVLPHGEQNSTETTNLEQDEIHERTQKWSLFNHISWTCVWEVCIQNKDKMNQYNNMEEQIPSIFAPEICRRWNIAYCSPCGQANEAMSHIWRLPSPCTTSRFKPLFTLMWKMSQSREQW